MLDLNSVISQMLILLILMLVGFAAGRLDVIDETAVKKLSRITLTICQSAMILGSVMNLERETGLLDILSMLGVSCAAYIILMSLAFALPFILRIKGADTGVYRFMTAFGNVGFMGFPVIDSVFGSEYVFYASIFNIPFNVLVYTVGIVFLSGGREKGRFNWRILINAPLVSTLVAVVLLLSHLPVPYVVERATDYLGDMVVPCALMTIGASLSFMPLRQVFSDWRVYVFSALKLLLLPVAVWALLRLFISDPIVIGIATVLAAMPVAANATLLSVQYGDGAALASRGVFVSTVLSVATIPLVVYLLLI